MKNVVKGFKSFNRINEQEEENMEAPLRLYGAGDTPQRQLINELKDLIEMIKKSNPTSQEEYEAIKEEIRAKGEEVKSHEYFEEFRDTGFKWQDQVIKLSDWRAELKSAVMALHQKVVKKGLA